MLPGLFALGFGVLAGIALSIHGIRTALRKYRSQMVWLILGLMLGSVSYTHLSERTAGHGQLAV